MSKEMQVFKNEEFGSIRVILIDGNPWFIGVEIARRLGYDNPRSTVHNYIDKEYTCVSKINTQGQMRNVTLINEAGLYQLIFHSELSSAKAFQKWVFEEVLPSIRKHGVYATNNFLEKSIADPAWAIGVLTALKAEQDKNKQLTKEVSELKPKANYCDQILQCPDLVPVSVIAQDYGYTAQKFNQLLYDLGVQYKRGEMWFLYAEYVDKDWTQTKTYEYKDSKGNGRCNTHTYWTQKGRLGLYELLRENKVLPKIERGE